MLPRIFKKQVKKELYPVRQGFNAVARDVAQLQGHVSHLHVNTGKWHQYLHQRALEVEGKIGRVKHDVASESKEHVDRLRKQVESELDQLRSHISTKNESSDDALKAVERLRSHLGEVFSGYNRHIVHLHTKLEGIEKRFTQKLEDLEAKRESAPAQSIMPPKVERHVVVEESEPQVQPLRTIAGNLTQAQRQLLAILAKSPSALSYRDIAATYGKSPSTIKTQLFSLKRAGIPVQESSELGVKRFFLDEQYKKVILSKTI